MLRGPYRTPTSIVQAIVSIELALPTRLIVRGDPLPGERRMTKG